jgi:two-component system CheB/CheR fusion protein
MENKYIIAIGASAGGLSALSEFFDNTLPDGISYVITTHMYAHQKSMLTEIIQRHSSIEVCTVGHDMEINSNMVYVMPENKIMTIDKGKLILTNRDLSIKVNMSIDIFFNSLAKDKMFQKIAIVLSGMGNDGTKGVEALAKAGGYIIAQSPGTADEVGMPTSIITAGYINAILHPKEMPQAIIDYINK